MISIFFTRDGFGEGFFGLPELKSLKNLLVDSDYGLRIQHADTVLIKQIKAIEQANQLERLINFIAFLGMLSRSTYKVLSSQINLKKYAGDEGNRMRDIFRFSMQHYDRSIRLREISDIANMTPNAFCRYFKQRTNKSYVRFLTELRIENACKLLARNENLSIAEIAERSGFNNLANFNRKFREIKQVTPSGFRKKFGNPVRS
jgi:AraC-like DNA-binding protein